jgi:hypothetical protein
MYIRWQSRDRRSREFGRGRDRGDVHWRAILVENVRIDGMPTQRHIAYLAGFTESALTHPAQRRFLWERIEEKFDRLRDRISADDRKRIEKLLITRIGKPPTKAQRAALDRRREKLLTGMTDWLPKNP